LAVGAAQRSSARPTEVTASMMETEKTMNELQFVTGRASVEEAPSLLQNEISPLKRAKQLN
jgi:hypothetical protein